MGVFEEGDRDHLVALDGALQIGSYLSVDEILAAADCLGCSLLHPGYGYLRENADFARAVIAAGIRWVGPPPEAIEVMGNKTVARRRMEEAGVPVVPSEGFPCLVKASGGGGGRGMRLVRRPEDLEEAKASAAREALAAFGNDEIFVERYIEGGRHVEVQVLADGHGGVVHLHERECSVQRRHQKVVEEAPHFVKGLTEAAVLAVQAIGYQSAGTVEFLVSDEGFYFLEMNTRIQVEHPVTECITGLDLVAEQLRIALGGAVPSVPEAHGHAIEARIYAEDPYEAYAPRTGTVLDLHLPELPGVRLDTHLHLGSVVGVRYDPMLAKLIAHGQDREEARRRLVHALRQLSLLGLTTNKAQLVQILEHEDFVRGTVHTAWLEAQEFAPPPVAPEARRAVLAHELRGLGSFHGFRNNRFRDQELSIEGEVLRWSLTRRGLESEGLPLHVDRHGVELKVQHGLWSFVARVVDTPEGWEVWTSSGQARLGRDPIFPEHSSAEEQGGLVSQMPGKVLKVFVAVGDRVEQGQSLLVLEAMKMEQTLRAPSDGVVEELFVVEGEQVDPGQVLARLSALGED